jgi:hypothetical protein
MTLLKATVKDKYSFKQESEIVKMIDTIENGNIEAWLWNRIIQKMYEEDDQL